MPENQPGCEMVASAKGPEGTNFAEMRIIREGLPYQISIASQGYLDDLNVYNLKFTPSDRLDTNILTLSDLSSEQVICSQLAKISLEKLQPYLTPVNSSLTLKV